MTKVVVTEKALREMVREAMWNTEYSGWSSNHDGPATVNSDVDPSASVTDPVNPNFTPQNKTEFGVAVNQLVKNLPDADMPELFDTVKTAIDQNEKKKDEEEMTKKAAQGGTDQVEEAVRKNIRKILADLNPRWGNISEAKPVDWSKLPPVTGPLPPVRKIPAGVHGGEFSRRIEKTKADLKKGLGKAAATIDAPVTAAEMGVEEPPVAAGEEASEEATVNPEAPQVGDGVPDAPGKRKVYKASALGTMHDVDYDEDLGQRKPMTFEEIAAEMGFSVAGAKQAVDKAFEKAKFLFGGGMDEDDREILILTALNDYITFLTKSGELTPADIKLMKDHPDIVRELDGFREFLHNHIRRARRADQKLYNPVKDDDDNGSTPPVAVGESKRPILLLRRR